MREVVRELQPPCGPEEIQRSKRRLGLVTHGHGPGQGQFVGNDSVMVVILHAERNVLLPEGGPGDSMRLFLARRLRG